MRRCWQRVWAGADQQPSQQRLRPTSQLKVLGLRPNCPAIRRRLQPCWSREASVRRSSGCKCWYRELIVATDLIGEVLHFTLETAFLQTHWA